MNNNKSYYKKILFEQKTNDAEVNGFTKVKESQLLQGYTTILTPSGTASYVPDGTKILSVANNSSDFDVKNYSAFLNWMDKSRGGQGDTWTDQWIPSSMSQIITKDSVLSFLTPDNKKYKAFFSHPSLNKVKSWDEFRTITDNGKATPNGWIFSGYETAGGNVYTPPSKPKLTWYESFWNWIKEGGWQIIAEVAISIVAGVLTGGMSLATQAIIQGLIGVAFSIDDLTKGDYLGVGLTFLIVSVPIVGRLSKLGTKAPSEFVKKWGSTIKNLKTEKDLKLFFNMLDENEKLLLTRALKQDPAELKKNTSKYLVNSLLKLEKEGKIELSKIPLKQKLWWKRTFEEVGVPLPAVFGISYAVGKQKQKDFESQLSGSLISGEYTYSKEEEDLIKTKISSYEVD
jgi:hypothetical protein